VEVEALSSQLQLYYGRRAGEYEGIYQRPERQSDLRALASLVCAALAGHDVLEIACGTGYWTEAFAPVARSVLATDTSSEVLELARRKSYPPGRVRLAEADAYAPHLMDGRFTAAFAGFWWSHVPREAIDGFLRGLHGRLGAGARVVLCDNRYVEGNSTPIARADAGGNTYQSRRLAIGDTYDVLKNFPSADELRRVLQSHGAVDLTLTELTYYWCLTYFVGAPNP
jgi:demethylmenaquinone methyltransferase/2-methoxy-6-polyprenyl-1,4-benzoquinol methylase